MSNIAAALPFAIAPTIAPAILAVGGGSYSVLYAVAPIIRSKMPRGYARC